MVQSILVHGLVQSYKCQCVLWSSRTRLSVWFGLVCIGVWTGMEEVVTRQHPGGQDAIS